MIFYPFFPFPCVGSRLFRLHKQEKESSSAEIRDFFIFHVSASHSKSNVIHKSNFAQVLTETVSTISSLS